MPKNAQQTKPDPITRAHKSNKVFIYQKGNVVLSFSLCLDNDDIPVFIDLLRCAEKELVELNGKAPVEE